MVGAKRGKGRAKGGRPSPWQNKPTRTIRVPSIFADALLEVARTLDSGREDLIVLDPTSLDIQQHIKRHQVSATPPRRFSHAGHKVVRIDDLIEFFQKYQNSD